MKPQAANFLVSLVGVLSVASLGLGAPVSESSALVARETDAHKSISKFCIWAQWEGHGYLQGCEDYAPRIPEWNGKGKGKDNVSFIDLCVEDLTHLTVNRKTNYGIHVPIC